MDEKELNKRLRDLIGEVANLKKRDQEKLQPLIKETKQRQKDIKKNVDKVHKSIEDLTICVKYILFDLEATRRERDNLIKILKNKNKDNNDDNPNTISEEM